MNEKNDRKYGALVFGDIWLPVKSLLEKAGRAKTVINVEQNIPGSRLGHYRITGISVITAYSGLTGGRSSQPHFRQ